ncbi:MAG: hypothetical protein E6501_01525, partial [Bradyrhizobium sp.]|nr:hypothetical protein [Bradyrhizobium sp.]
MSIGIGDEGDLCINILEEEVQIVFGKQLHFAAAAVSAEQPIAISADFDVEPRVLTIISDQAVEGSRVNPGWAARSRLFNETLLKQVG